MTACKGDCNSCEACDSKHPMEKEHLGDSDLRVFYCAMTAIIFGFVATCGLIWLAVRYC